VKIDKKEYASVLQFLSPQYHQQLIHEYGNLS